MRSYLKLSFLSDTISKGKDLQEVVSSMSRIKSPSLGDKYALSSGKCPSLIFFYTDKRKDVKPKKDEKGPAPLTREAELSRKAADDVFNSDDSYKIYILAKFFSCIEVNTGNITAADNPIISSENSPMLVLADIEGKVKLSAVGATIGFGKISSGMMEIIQEYYPNIGTLVNQLNPLMTELEKAEYQLIDANMKIGELNSSKEKKDSSSYKTKLAKLNAELKEGQDKKIEVTKRMDEIIKDFLATNKKEEKKT